MTSSDAAQQLLQDTVTRYAELVSYADEGTVSQRINAQDPDLVIRFNTRYRKPAQFRFDFELPHPYPPLRERVTHCTVVGDGAVALFVMQPPEQQARIEVRPNLSLAIAGATGISAGAAHNIPRLLLPEVAGLSLLDLVEPQLQDATRLGSTACHVIAARHPRSGERWELYIEKDTLLVRRIRTRGADETHEHIRVDAALDAGLFRTDAAAAASPPAQ